MVAAISALVVGIVITWMSADIMYSDLYILGEEVFRLVPFTLAVLDLWVIFTAIFYSIFSRQLCVGLVVSAFGILIGDMFIGAWIQGDLMRWPIHVYMIFGIVFVAGLSEEDPRSFSID